MVEMPWPMSLFDHRDTNTTGYCFVMPHIAISGQDLPLDFDHDRKQWHVVQEENGLRWEAYGDSQPETILALIARRMGLRVTFQQIDEDAGDDA